MSRLPTLRPLFAAAVALATFSTLAPVAAKPLRGLIEPSDLKTQLGNNALVVVDIRSGETREAARALFARGHVPGAVHADYAHASWRLPREKISVYLPEPAQFEILAGGLGIGNESDVVIVHEGSDATSFGAAARVYWTFKSMGHASVAILNGGWRGWTADTQNPIATGLTQPTETFYEAKPEPGTRAHLSDVIAASTTRSAKLVDSRPESYFSGLEKHKSVRAFGHIPGAVNIPHSRAIGPDFRVRDRAALEAAFSAIGTEPSITYCNTGHWAATDWFILSEVLGRRNVRLYDGSMLEFAADSEIPVANPRGQNGS